MLVGGRGAALLQVSEETVDVLDGVGLKLAGKAQPATDAAEVLQGRAVAEDGVLGLPLDLDRGQVRGDGVVDLSHGDAPPSSLVTTSLTLLGDESKSLITFRESPCLGAGFGAPLPARTGRNRARARGVRRFGAHAEGRRATGAVLLLCLLVAGGGFEPPTLGL